MKLFLGVGMLVLGLGFVVGADAQTLTVNPSSVNGLTAGGATTPGSVSLDFAGLGSGVQGFQADVTFNDLAISASPSPVTPANHFVTCQLVGTTIVRVAVANTASAAVVDGSFCTVGLSVVPGTAAATYPLAIGNTVNLPGPNVDGAVVVSAGPQPALSSVPVPGSTITINDIVGGGATTSPLTISNTGQVGSTLNIQAPTGLSGVLSISPNTAQNVAQGAAGAAYTISCTAAAVGTTSQVLSFGHNGTSPGSPVTYNVDCVGVTGPTAPTASLGAVVQPPAGPINLTASGSVPVNVDTAGVATASLALNCTIPATGASNFQITGGGSRTINAPATVGANAPAIGVSCVRQAAAVNATLSCAQTANPLPSPAPLTATVTCPLGTVAPNGASSPAPGGTVNATAVAGTTATGNLLFTNALPGGTAPYDLTNCTASAGFTITSPTFPATIAAGGSQVLTVSCLAPAVGTSTAGTLSCTTTDPVFGNPTYILSCNGVSAVVPAIGSTGKILLASLVIGLGLLGMGLRRQA